MSDASDSGVAVLLGVVTEQLVGEQCEAAVGVRSAADHVGEGAAPVDPKLPFIFAYH